MALAVGQRGRDALKSERADDAGEKWRKQTLIYSREYPAEFSKKDKGGQTIQYSTLE
jgi:hypothetical protein